MPHKKRKYFTKDNSVKFLLLHGNTQATNADGETLENVLVPVSKTYKPGMSLLMSNIANLVQTPCAEDNIDVEDGDLDKIMSTFDDEDLSPEMKNLRISCSSKRSKAMFPESNYDIEIESDYSDSDGQFSDVSDNSAVDNDYEALTSSKLNCPENLKIFNERFEQMLGEYDDDQIGALDNEEICGHLSTENERVKGLIEESSTKEEAIELGNYDASIKEKILNYAEESEDENYVEIVTKKPLEFDCESILSTYSNQYNHPTVIKEETKIKKIKIPDNPLKKKLTKMDLKQLNNENDSDDDSDDNLSLATSCNIRLKGETPEERRERKSLFKEAKRESRMLKKENKLAFKKEKKLQKAQAVNSQFNKGIKLL